MTGIRTGEFLLILPPAWRTFSRSGTILTRLADRLSRPIRYASCLPSLFHKNGENSGRFLAYSNPPDSRSLSQRPLVEGLSKAAHRPHFTNQEKFTDFYSRISRPLWLYILCNCGDEALSDEIFQESFLRFIRKAPSHLQEHQMKAYLYKTAARLVIDRARRIKTEREGQHDIKAFEGDNTALSMSLDMRKIFLLLKPKERALLWLAFVEEYSHREIASIMSAGEKSIKVMLHRAKKKFAALLEGKGYSMDSLSGRGNTPPSPDDTEA